MHNLKIILLYLFLTVSASVGAQEINISGYYTYAITGTTATINIDRIQNTSTSTSTGTLYVTVRMTENSSPFSSGYNVVRQALTFIGSGTGQLSPNSAYTDIRFSAEYTAPPAGTYYVHLMVSQFPNLDTALETETFDDLITISSSNPGSGNNGGGNGLGIATISGSYSYHTQGDIVHIEVEKISNNSQNFTTGTLYLTLRMTENTSPFSTGYNVARQALTFGTDSSGQLSPGEYYQYIQFTADYDRPPNGNYYVHLMVSQYPDLNTAVDTASFTQQASINEPVTAPVVTPLITQNTSADNSNSGAGSVGGLSFALILIVTVFRKHKQ